MLLETKQPVNERWGRSNCIPNLLKVLLSQLGGSSCDGRCLNSILQRQVILCLPLVEWLCIRVYGYAHKLGHVYTGGAFLV